MDQKPETTENKTTTTWTTWEELLLACAVKRHGFNDWDTVSLEIQCRSSLPHIFTTPRNCKLKFLDLKRRFNRKIQENDDESDTTTTTTTASDDETIDDTVPWLEELRNLRVAELRQEVHRYDVSIMSLQLKVKRLEDECERNLQLNGDDDEKPDLEETTKEGRSENDKKEIDNKPQNNLPNRVVGKSVSDEESYRENQSVNESSSTDPKGEIQNTGLEKPDKVHEPDKYGSKELDPVSSQSKPAGEDSCNESSDSIAKGLGVKPEAKQKNKTERDSSELRDSVSESKRLLGGTKESSDVQSSASLTRRAFLKCGGAGEEPEAETASAAIKQISVKSQPLVGVMELIRSHKRGSLFFSRLESQESDKYNNLVRQHMDFQTMQKKLEQGFYSSCARKFYRDILLLFNNAIVFFPKSSVESVTASELRNLVANEMSKQTQRSESSPEPSLSPPIQPQPKPDPKNPELLLAKQKPSAPIIVCRKRSSISSKAAAATSVVSSRKNELQSEEKKPAVEVKSPSVKSTRLVQEQSLMKIDTKDRIVTGSRSFRRSNTILKNSADHPNNQSNSPASNKKVSPTTEKNNKKEKEKEIQASTKKRGAADFLRRIKGNSPLEKSKSSANDSKNSRQNNGSGGGDKRKRIEKKDGREDRLVLRPKQATKEETSPSKRSVGRPPKKAVDSVLVKRRREAEASTSKRPKKQSRR